MSAYSDNYKLIRWAPPKPGAPDQAKPEGPKGPFFMPDIAPFVAPGHELISSRPQLREYERKHGVRQVGELKTAADFDNQVHKPVESNRRALDAAFRAALEKAGV